MDVSYTITASSGGVLLVTQSATLSNRTAEQVEWAKAEGAKMVNYARGLVRPEGNCVVTLQFGDAPVVTVQLLKRSGVVDLLQQVADEWIGNGIKS